MSTRKEYTKGRQSTVRQAERGIDTAGGCPEASPPPFRSRSILIMAGGTGGHIFGYAITRAAHALVPTENATNLGEAT